MLRYLCYSQYLITVLVVLSSSPSLQEILWKFSCLKDKKKCLTLRDNPHFYVELPTSPEAYGDGVKIDPTEDFRHANKFYVLTDRPEPIHIVTDQETHVFGNFWCSQNFIIFKGLGDLFLLSPAFSDISPDICGRLRGGSIVKASLKGTYCWFCKQPPVVSHAIDPGSSKSHRRLRPIITPYYPLEVECLISCHSLCSSVNFSLCICTWRAAPNSAVRYDITHSTGPANIDIAPGSFATNI